MLFGVKPSAIASRIAHPTLPGCKLLVPFVTPGYDTRNHAAADVPDTVGYVGRPTWQDGPCGPELGGFTGTDYAQLDANASGMATQYPFWLAAVYRMTSTAQGSLISFGNDSTNNQVADLIVNTFAGGDVTYWLRDNAGLGPDSGTLNTAVGPTVYDGNPHLVYGISYASDDHRLGFESVQINSTSTAITLPISFNTCSIGVMHRTTIISIMPGSVLWAASGQGAAPNFSELYAQMFEHLQPQRRRRVAASAATGSLFLPATLSLGSGGPFFATSVNG